MNPEPPPGHFSATLGPNPLRGEFGTVLETNGVMRPAGRPECPECGHPMHPRTDPAANPDTETWSCHCGVNMTQRLIIGPGVKHLLKPRPEP